eukprot:scaffold559_cov358-Prasinococcus_capsulatus_cf.AAC.3
MATHSCEPYSPQVEQCYPEREAWESHAPRSMMRRVCGWPMTNVVCKEGRGGKGMQPFERIFLAADAAPQLARAYVRVVRNWLQRV